jgi:hypothetical protein
LLDPDSYRGEPPDWRPVLAHAEALAQKKDLYEARHLYLQSARLAAWRVDWQGLLAAACGMKRIEGGTGSYFNTREILVQSMAAAERNQIRAGLSVVAKAFAAIGENTAPGMARLRIQAARAKDDDKLDAAVSSDCWQSMSRDDRLEARPKQPREAG